MLEIILIATPSLFPTLPRIIAWVLYVIAALILIYVVTYLIKIGDMGMAYLILSGVLFVGFLITGWIGISQIRQKSAVLHTKRTESKESTMEVGKESVVMGNVPKDAKVGDGSVVIGATDANGNTIIDQPMAVGHGAEAGPGSIAIGAGAKAGLEEKYH